MSSSSVGNRANFDFLNQDSTVAVDGEPLSKAILTYYNSDMIAQREFDLKTDEGAHDYLSWLVVNNNRLQGLNLESYFTAHPALLRSLLYRVKVGSHSLPAAFYAPWKYQADLRHGIDIGDLKGTSRLVGELMDRSSFFRSNAGIFDSFLSQQVPGVEIPLIWYAIYLTRPQYFNFLDPAKFEDRAKLIGQSILDGQLDFFGDLNLSKFLMSPVGPFGVPMIAYSLWKVRDDLRHHLDLKTDESAARLNQWLESQALEQHPILQKWLGREGAAAPQVTFEKSSLGTSPPLREGVNLIGFPFSVSGIGEDLRMLARILDRLGVDYGVIETPIESPSDKRYEFPADKVLKTPRYKTTIFCLPCSEIFRFVAHYPREFFKGQFLIAMMPWELPKWPTNQIEILRMFDEIWSYSEFIQNTIAAVSPRPVQLIKRYIEAPQSSRYGREHFGINPNAYVFLYIFDSLSVLTRKNPLGVIEAFKRAFGSSDAKVQLVLKTMKSSYDKDAKALIDEITKNKNILLTDKTLDDEEITGLMTSCDCYVSLHRAEGFGLTIANAMLAEKPVIVSAFSGNLDFCNDQTAYLVDGKLVDLKRGQYFYTEGQQWFEADVEDAARKMRFCYEGGAEAKKIARAGRDFIAAEYGIENAKKSIASRLRGQK